MAVYFFSNRRRYNVETKNAFKHNILGYTIYFCKVAGIYANWSILLKWVKANFNNHYIDFLAEKDSAQLKEWMETEKKLSWKCSSPRMCVNMDASSCFVLLKVLLFLQFSLFTGSGFFFTFLRTDLVVVAFFPLPICLVCVQGFYCVYARSMCVFTQGGWISISSMLPPFGDNKW